MGYCIRCGNLSHTEKCGKCGGKLVASIATGLTTEKRRLSSGDKWKSQYAESILSEPFGGTVSTLRSKRDSTYLTASVVTTNNRRPSLPIHKACVTCKKQLSYDSAFLNGNVQHCRTCRPPDACVSCTEPVSEEEAFYSHSQLWHRGCFRCQGCHKLVEDCTQVDKYKQPWCETCRKENEIGSRPSSSASTPLMSPMDRSLPQLNTSPTSTISSRDQFDSIRTGTPDDFNYGTISLSSNIRPIRTMSTAPTGTRPPITSQLFQQYQKSLQQPIFIASNEDQPLLSNLPPPTPPKRHPSTPRTQLNTPLPRSSPVRDPSKRHSYANDNSLIEKQPIIEPSRSASTRQPTERPTERPTEKPTEKPSRKPTKEKRVCCKCLKTLRGRRIKAPTATGDAWYHYDCLTCAGCNLHFTDTEIVVEGTDIYHPQCRVTSMPEEVVFKCHACELPIQDKQCLKDGTKLFHHQCFTCHGCHTVLPPDQPFYDMNGSLHCETCARKRTISSSMMANNQRQQQNRRVGPRASLSTPLVRTTPQDSLGGMEEEDNPSEIFRQRQSRAFPKLGGSRMCPRCRQSIAIMDDSPGPRATRWHKKCLRCAGCRKQMDSGAKVTEGADGEWLVHCRNCMDKNVTEAYVR
ncbi:hypothetical protein CLU79DRAFT_774310 [Phycomyces nitens]|nr:hypothetical protein CLU79DRAFT_774310 [Phycomyces nitens]